MKKIIFILFFLLVIGADIFLFELPYINNPVFIELYKIFSGRKGLYGALLLPEIALSIIAIILLFIILSTFKAKTRKGIIVSFFIVLGFTLVLISGFTFLLSFWRG